jgi:hypothetical protein
LPDPYQNIVPATTRSCGLKVKIIQKLITMKKENALNPMSDPAIAGSLLLTEVNYALRNFALDNMEITSPEEGKINIVAGDICCNKIRALQPVIDKYKLIWFVRDNYTEPSKVRLHLFIPKY